MVLADSQCFRLVSNIFFLLVGAGGLEPPQSRTSDLQSGGLSSAQHPRNQKSHLLSLGGFLWLGFFLALRLEATFLGIVDAGLGAKGMI
jgi:hypothetical protein